jgi:hypothetical protein
VDEILDSIPSLIMQQDNLILMAPFTLSEIHGVVFSMPVDKAPGPDGFTTLFFQKCWDVICFELLEALEESRKNVSILKNFNTTNIALIPKVNDPYSFADFHPISLCNTIYKIITKAIYLRLKPIIPKIISTEQGGFVLGRETTEGAIIAHETLHSIKEHNISAFVVKLDMMKAYDKLNWFFLLLVLHQFGFSSRWCKWIKACISGAHFSILINGAPAGFFASSQGVRQGDPLSPFLFIIMAEALSRLINSFNQKGLWKGINIIGTSLSITHSLFADDTLLFGSSTYQEAQSMKKAIDLYTQVSGQCINATKSKIYVFNTSQLVSQRIIHLLGFPRDHLPSTYLGVPFFMGLNKPSYWKSVIDCIKSRISAWKVWLSLSGRILLIKIVLSAIPNYYFSILQAPKGIISQIETLILTFLWSDNMNGQKKIPLISIHAMSTSCRTGGVRLPNITNRNKAFGAKLVWQMYEKPSAKWCHLLQEKYLDNLEPSRVLTVLDPPKGSVIWDFMMASREVITSFISWQVNNGDSVNF